MWLPNEAVTLSFLKAVVFDKKLQPLVERNKPLFSVYELAHVAQKFLAGDRFLFSIQVRSNSWVGMEKLRVFSFQILAKDVAYILSNLGLLSRRDRLIFLSNLLA